MTTLDWLIAELDPRQRIAELEQQNAIFRAQRDSEIEQRLFAEELLARSREISR